MGNLRAKCWTRPSSRRLFVLWKTSWGRSPEVYPKPSMSNEALASKEFILNNAHVPQKLKM